MEGGSFAEGAREQRIRIQTITSVSGFRRLRIWRLFIGLGDSQQYGSVMEEVPQGAERMETRALSARHTMQVGFQTRDGNFTEGLRKAECNLLAHGTR